MFTFRVSSLNYAPWCSVVSVPGLIWMFVRKSEGWKKRSQTGNPAPLMSPQKWHFCPEFITRHYAWQVIWYALNADVKSIFEALARLLHRTRAFDTGRSSFPKWDRVYVFTLPSKDWREIPMKESRQSIKLWWKMVQSIDWKQWSNALLNRT